MSVQSVLRDLNILPVVVPLCLKLIKTLLFNTVECMRMLVRLLPDVLLNSLQDLLGFVCLLDEVLFVITLALLCDFHALLQFDVAFTGTLQLFVLDVRDVLLDIFLVFFVPVVALFVKLSIVVLRVLSSV